MTILLMLNFLLSVCSLAFYSVAAVRYTPDWNSLDSRPLPQWYDDAKVGIFLHWGVFSSPSYGVGESKESSFLWLSWQNNVSEVVQYMKQNYPPYFTYADFAATFHAEFFNPDEWADLFKSAHARLVSDIFIDSVWYLYFTVYCIIYNYRREAYRLRADIVMSVVYSGRIIDN